MHFKRLADRTHAATAPDSTPNGENIDGENKNTEDHTSPDNGLDEKNGDDANAPAYLGRLKGLYIPTLSELPGWRGTQ
jgi:hypothetical protein